MARFTSGLLRCSLASLFNEVFEKVGLEYLLDVVIEEERTFDFVRAVGGHVVEGPEGLFQDGDPIPALGLSRHLLLADGWSQDGDQVGQGLLVGDERLEAFHGVFGPGRGRDVTHAAQSLKQDPVFAHIGL